VRTLATPVLRVEDLRVTFEVPGGTIHAVNGVSFELHAGECLGVVGESGSGKSVTMLALLGLLPRPPARIEAGRALLRTAWGEVDLLGLRERDLEPIRGGSVGIVFQDPSTALNPVMRVGEQIAEPLRVHRGMNRRAALREAVRLLRAVGFADAERRAAEYPHQLSGGTRQRVMIAIAMAAEPAVVVFDEPTTALDVTVQAQILQLVRARLLADRRTAVVWITHDLGVIAGLADRVMVMYGGTVAERAPVGRIFRRPLHPYTIGLLGAIPTAVGDGHRLATIEGSPPSLMAPLRACPFAPRCRYRVDRCLRELPPLEPVDEEHEVACFVDVATGGSRP
jgi:peptide/nickel transport system ATP-binding protein/oligopeptide transport system ATP-binding protein